VEVVPGPEADGIAVELGVPATSGPPFNAAKAAVPPGVKKPERPSSPS
jgi:hypothetical protein